MDPDGTLRYANPAWERALGYDPEQAVGTMNVLDHVHPEDLAHVLEETEKALAKGGAATNEAEYRFRRRDGSWRWMQSVGTYLLDDPAVGGVVVTSRDVTEGKEAEEEKTKLARRATLRADISAALAGGGPLRDILQRCTEAMVRHLGAAFARIWTLDEGKDVLELRASAGMYTHTDGFHGRVPLGSFKIGLIAQARLPHLTNDVLGDPRVHDKEWAEREGMVAFAGYPLLVEGKVVGVVALFARHAFSEDTTEVLASVADAIAQGIQRKWTESALQASEERFRSLVQNASDTITILDADGVVRYVSPAVESMLGYRPEELTGIHMFGLVHPDDVERASGSFEEVLGKPGSSSPLEFRVPHKDGSWRHMEATLTNLLDDPGVSGVVVNARDTTERNEAEERLREAEERYRTLVERVPAMTYIHRQVPGGFSGTIYVSPQVEAVLGYTQKEYTSDPEFWQTILHPDDRERVLTADESTGESGEPFDLEFRMIAKDGRVVWFRESGTLVRDEEGQGQIWHGVMVDITELKRTEGELRETENRYRTLVERIPAVTYIERVTDGPEEPLYTSPQIETILGYAPEEWMEGRLWPKRLHPDDRERVLAADERFEGGTDEVFDEEYRLLAKDGRVVWVRDEAVVLRDGEGKPLYWQGIMHDVTERREAEERLEYQAFHDGLTGLPNRRLFLDRLGHALARTQRRRGKRVAVLFMDLDEFKVVNDSLGHGTGDKLLVAVSERLKGCLRHEDTLARFGGDEFTVLLEDIEDPDEPMRVAKRIIDKLRDPLELDGRGLYARASIGIALGEDRTKNPEELMREADTAMYRAKAEGSGYTVFDPTMHGRAVFRLELENDLRRAVEEYEFVVHYQPIVNLQTGELWGTEALVRWDHPERGILNPDEFVPLAEESGLVVPMGEQVLREACLKASEWQESHPRTPPLVMSVNLSVRQLSRPNLAESVEGILKETGLAGSCLTLDITETVYVKALAGNTATLDRLRGLGAKISIDDFGMGYSSLAYLKRLPADSLKIDRSFMRGLCEDVEDTAIVHMIIELAHTLGLEVVGEGVEREEQAGLLREMGCDMAQGYHYSKPLPAQEISALLSSGTRI